MPTNRALARRIRRMAAGSQKGKEIGPGCYTPVARGGCEPTRSNGTNSRRARVSGRSKGDFVVQVRDVSRPRLVAGEPLAELLPPLPADVGGVADGHEPREGLRPDEGPEPDPADVVVLQRQP